MEKAERRRNSPGGQGRRQEPWASPGSRHPGSGGKRLTQLVLGTLGNMEADSGLAQIMGKGPQLLTLIHRPGDLCGCDVNVHPHPEHRSGPVGRTLS